MKKRLYLLEANSNGYDQYRGMVVRAASAKDARKVASKQDSVQPEKWFDKKHTSCMPLSSTGKSEVILSDFIAG